MAKKKEFPVAFSTKSFKALLDQMGGAGIPDKANLTWLKTLGYRSGNHGSYITALKYIGVVAPNGAPTELWNAFRAPSEKNKAALGEAIKEAYRPLYSTYDDAQDRSDAELVHVFKGHAAGGDGEINKMVGTFKTLASYASFAGHSENGSGKTEQASLANVSEVVAGNGSPAKQPEVARVGAATGMALTVNIELQLPATADADVYDKLFSAMRKHLVGMA